MCCIFFFKQKTAYEMVSCDWSSDVCSSDLAAVTSKCKKQCEAAEQDEEAQIAARRGSEKSQSCHGDTEVEAVRQETRESTLEKRAGHERRAHLLTHRPGQDGRQPQRVG